MKNILALFITIFILVGCDINNNGSETKSTETVTSLISDSSFSTDIFVNPSSIVISSEEALQTTLADLNQTAQNISINTNQDKEMILYWIEILNNANIDFNKDNILIYTVTEGEICQFNEIITQKNETHTEIEFSLTSDMCDSSIIVYYWFYKVSKEIEQITIKPFYQTETNINMLNVD